MTAVLGSLVHSARAIMSSFADPVVHMQKTAFATTAARERSTRAAHSGVTARTAGRGKCRAASRQRVVATVTTNPPLRSRHRHRRHPLPALARVASQAFLHASLVHAHGTDPRTASAVIALCAISARSPKAIQATRPATARPHLRPSLCLRSSSRAICSTGVRTRCYTSPNSTATSCHRASASALLSTPRHPAARMPA